VFPAPQFLSAFHVGEVVQKPLFRFIPLGTLSTTPISILFPDRPPPYFWHLILTVALFPSVPVRICHGSRVFFSEFTPPPPFVAFFELVNNWLSPFPHGRCHSTVHGSFNPFSGPLPCFLSPKYISSSLPSLPLLLCFIDNLEGPPPPADRAVPEQFPQDPPSHSVSREAPACLELVKTLHV